MSLLVDQTISEHDPFAIDHRRGCHTEFTAKEQVDMLRREAKLAGQCLAAERLLQVGTDKLDHLLHA